LVFIGIKSGDLSPVDYTANSDDILKKLDQVIEKLDNAEAHIKKLEGHIEGLETRFQTTVTTTVLQDPGVLEPTKKQVKKPLCNEDFISNNNYRTKYTGQAGQPRVQSIEVWKVWDPHGAIVNSEMGLNTQALFIFGTHFLLIFTCTPCLIPHCFTDFLIFTNMLYYYVTRLPELVRS
jgi:hypothetical protein